MAEVQILKIKSIYGDIKGLIDQIPPLKDSSIVSEFIVDQFNFTIDDLISISNSDYSRYKVPDSQRSLNFPKCYKADVVRVQINRLISKLEEEYNFGHDSKIQSPEIVIFNKNENDISLKINYNITNLIEKYSDDETKHKLSELDEELKKPNKNWGNIKGILIWILNFSKDLFLEIIPIVLQNKL